MVWDEVRDRESGAVDGRFSQLRRAAGSRLTEVGFDPAAEGKRRVGGPFPVIHREVTRLIDGGVLLERTVGRSRIVRANHDYPLDIDTLVATHRVERDLRPIA